MTAYKLLVIISYLLRSCFAPTDIFALRQMHPKFQTPVQSSRFNARVNLKSKISNLKTDVRSPKP
jgi:hypothetical protein